MAIKDGGLTARRIDEWDAWKLLVEKLVETGAVTRRDADSSQSKDSTPGQKLFRLIRNWGAKKVAMEARR